MLGDLAALYGEEADEPGAASAEEDAAGEPPPKRGRTSAGSASGGTDDDAIIRKMAALTCINSAKIRTLENHSYLTWILPATAALFVKLVETGRAYNEEAKKKDKKQKRKERPTTRTL